MNNVKLGIIGLGGIALSHLEHLRQMKLPAEVKAVAEIDEARMKRVSKQYSLGTCYLDPVQMLEQEELDAVILCTPPVRRAELIEKALAAGCAVLCEKPLATTLEEGEEILNICRRYPEVPVLVNFKMRQGQNFQKIREYLKQPEVGPPVTIICRYALVTDPQIWSPPKWFWDKQTSGGMLIENGGHMIDYLLWIAGEAEMLYGHTEQKCLKNFPEPCMRESDTGDHAVILMKHKGGCTTTFINTICYPGNRDASLEIATANGYFIELSECVKLKVRKGEQIIYESNAEDYGVGDGYLLKHLICDVLGKGMTPFITPQDGYRALQIAVAARESAQQQKWIGVSGI